MLTEYYITSGFFSLLMYLAIMFAIFLFIFLIIRVLVLWYWKIDHVVDKLEKISKSYTRRINMKAITQEIYGPPSVLSIQEVDPPKPKSDEVLVLIHIRAISLNAPDWRLLRGDSLLMRLASGIIKLKHLIKGTELVK